MRKLQAAAAGLTLLAAAVGAFTAGPAYATVITTSHTGSGAPALAHAGGRLYVAWAGSSGTATAKELVVGWSADNGQTITKLSTAERTAPGEGPALVADPDNPAGVVLAWADARAAGTLTATVYDGTAFGCRTAFTGLASRHAPALAADPSGKLYLAWTDTTDHLNVARLDTYTCATTHTLTLAARTALAPTSAYGPGLVFDTTSAGLHMLIAWVAPDAAHTLTVAGWAGSTTLLNPTTVNTAGAVATSAPALSSATADLYLAFRAADNHRHLGYSEGCNPACFRVTDTGTAVSSPIGAEATGATYAWFTTTGRLVIDSRFA